MKKRLLAILCTVALLLGAFAVGAAATVVNDGLYDVGYVKVDVNPWIQTSAVSYLDPETGSAGVPDNSAVWTDAAENIVKTNVAEGTVSMIRIPLGGYGDLGAAYSENLLDDNGDGKIGLGDGLAATVTSVTDDAGTTVIYITIDAVGAYGYLTEELRTRISAKLDGVSADHIMVSANHTHSGVNILKCYSDYKHHKLDENGNEVKVNGSWVYDNQDENGNPITAWGAYWIYFLETVTDAAVEAYNNATPATMKKGSIDVSEVVGGDLAFVRHYNAIATKKDGTVESAVTGAHFGPSSNDKVTTNVGNITAVVDANNTMGVLEFVPTDNSDPIVFVNWNAHSTIIGSSQGKVVSADYASSLRRYMEDAGYKAAFWQGAAGNLVPRTSDTAVANSSTYWVKYEDSKDAGLDIAQNKTSDTYQAILYGRLLSMAAEKCLDSKMASVETGTIRTLQSDYSFDLVKPSEGLVAAATAWEAAGAPSASSAFPYAYQHTDGKTYILNSFYHADKILELAAKTGDTFTYEMNVIMLGDELAMVAIPVEMFDRYDANGSLADADNDWLELVGETYGTPFVLGYTNEHGGYLPNVAAYNYNEKSSTYGTGCYEANVTNVAEGSGEEAIAQFKVMLNAVSNEKKATCPTCNKEVTWTPLTEAGFFSYCPKQAATLPDGHYYLMEDIDYRYVGTTPQRHQIDVSGTLCLDLNGHTINSYSRTLNVKSGATMTLLDSSATPGSIISNNGNTNHQGGAVIVDGTFNLYNATVQSNQSEAENSQDTVRGGTISVNANGIFNMYSGKVIGTQLMDYANLTTDKGCGGTIYSVGTLNLLGGEIVAGKAMDVGYGDCIYIGNSTATTKISGDAKIDEIFFETLTPAQIVVSGTYTGKTTFAYKSAVTLTEGLTVATSDNATISGKIYCGHYAGAVSGSNVVLTTTNQAAIGDTVYDTLAAALEAANGNTVTLLSDINDAVTISKNAVIDLNGCEMANVNVADGATLTCFDSTTDDYTVADGIYGKIAVYTGNVVGAEGYLKITENGETSFHKVDLAITAMSLRTAVNGEQKPSVYYRSNFKGDEVVARNVDKYGIAMNIREVPNASNMETTSAYSYFTTFNAGAKGNAGNGTLLKGIMKTSNSDKINLRNAQMSVYGRAYILTKDGQYIFGGEQARSLKEQVEAVDSLFDTFNSAAQSNAILMYKAYKSVMDNWNIPNIQAASDAANDGVLKVLVVGNSHGLDATNLLYEVFADQNPNQKVVLGALYEDGCRMSLHASYLSGNNAIYDYYKNGGEDDQNGEAWTVQKNVAGLVAFQDEQWDIVVMQQMNHRSGHDAADDFNANHYRTVINFIYDHQFAQPKLAYHMIWANPDGAKFMGGQVDDKGTEDTKDDAWVRNTTLGQNDINWVRWHQQWYGSGSTSQAFDGSFTSEAMYNGIIACTQKYIVDSTDFLGKDYFDFILPTGTAIQYAREVQNYDTKVSGMLIDPLQTLYRDYTHLSDFGRLIAAYTWYGAIMEEVTGADVTITNVGIDAISDTLHHNNSAYPAADANGAYTVTAEMKNDIIAAANWALANPFTLTEE